MLFLKNIQRNRIVDEYSTFNHTDNTDAIAEDWFLLSENPLNVNTYKKHLKRAEKFKKWLQVSFSKHGYISMWKRLVGSSAEFSIENRAFSAICIITFFLFVVLIPLNLVVGLPLISIIFSLLSLVLLTFYYYSRFRMMYKTSVIIFSVLSYITIIVCYYYSSGIKGTTIYFFFITLFLLMTITRQSLHWLWVSLHITIGLTLFAYEYYHSSWIVNSYSTKQSYYVDVASAYVLSLIFIFGVVKYLLSNIKAEKYIAKQRSEAIKKQNVQILAQNQKLEKLNMENNKLLSIISHDFRSPLTSIQGYLELFAEFSGDKGEEDMKRELLNITKNTSDMLLNLLVWSKHQMNGMVFQPKKINVHDYVNNILSIQKSLALHKKININCSIDKNVVVIADPDMFQVVIRNLLHNAIKFSPHGEQIFISQKIVGNECQICVKDNGVGIPLEKQQDIFLLTTHSTYGTGNEKGMSLGLTLCKEFIELQKGRIWFVSEPGKGSIFCVALPTP
jgi:signal transduction histidine kinase